MNALRNLALGVLTIAMTLSVIAFIPSKKVEAAGDVAINEENFPDAIFREYVSENFDIDQNGSLSDTEIDNIDKINIFGYKISSLQGINFFTALKTLECSCNKLSTLDVSKNTALNTLSCFSNHLTRI